AVGPFGERAGEVARVTTSTGGDVFHLVSGTTGAKVYVRGVAGFASYAWSSPSGADESSLRAELSSVEIRRIVYFRSAASLRLAAVEHDEGLILFERDGAAWDRVYSAEVKGTTWPVYALRAVLDMDDDGVPEVIEHFAEYADGRGFDVVVQRDSTGDWSEV